MPGKHRKVSSLYCTDTRKMLQNAVVSESDLMIRMRVKIESVRDAGGWGY